MLDARLELALQLYEKCELAADIGTDHAHLPASLLRNGKCRRMILTDISESALKNAEREMVRCRLLDRVELRLGDGLAPLTEACGMISILGMGGRTMAEILLRGRKQLRGASLLLSAHTDLERVRRAVMEIDYHVLSETPVRDNGRFYLMIKAAPGAEPMTASEIRTGKRLADSEAPCLNAYLAHRMDVLREKESGLLCAELPDRSRLDEVREDLAVLEAIYSGMNVDL